MLRIFTVILCLSCLSPFAIPIINQHNPYSNGYSTNGVVLAACIVSIRSTSYATIPKIPLV
jgi:hypothetical protein